MKTPNQLLPLLLIFVAWSVASTAQADTAGVVVAWGRNNYGQTTVPVAAQSGVTAIAEVRRCFDHACRASVARTIAASAAGGRGASLDFHGTEFA